MGFQSKLRNKIYSDPIQSCSPIRMVLDFGKEMQFKDLKVGDAFYFRGRIYKKTSNNNGKLIYSAKYFNDIFHYSDKKFNHDSRFNKDIVGETYRFDKHSLCCIAIMQFRPITIPDNIRSW